MSVFCGQGEGGGKGKDGGVISCMSDLCWQQWQHCCVIMCVCVLGGGEGGVC